MTVETETKPQGQLALIETLTPMVVFAEGGVDTILDKLTKEVRAIETDISTAVGRKAVASLAYKVVRSKTALDEMGKNLVADWKSKSAAVDAERRKIRSSLDALADEVRKPLTDWENADKLRIVGHEEALAHIDSLTVFAVSEPSSSETADRLAQLSALPIRDWQEFSGRAKKALDLAFFTLAAINEAAIKREAAVAEQERLRQEEAARLQQERDDRLRADAAEKARLEAEEKAAAEAKAEADRVEAERQAVAEETARQIEKIEEEKRQAAAEAERQRLAAEESRLAEAAEAERKRAAIEQEKRAAEERELTAQRRAEQADKDRIAAEAKAKADAEEAARKAETDRKAAAEQAQRDRLAAIETERRRATAMKASEEAEATRREQNRRHAAKINGEARDALIAAGLTVDHAINAVKAIAGGKVPHVKISY